MTPGATCGPGARTVFVFGGSTVWGTGAPDWGTLPAYLQAELQRPSDHAVCVVNYGESAYVSTQSVTQLLLLLQSGKVPQLVLFYEGWNDAYSAYQSGTANAHENYEQLAASFEGGGRRPEGNALVRAVEGTHLFSVTRYLVAQLTHHADKPLPLKTYASMGITADALAAEVATTYFANYEIVDALAHQYGFEYAFLWPPYIRIGPKPLVAAEQTIAQSVDPALDRLYQLVHQRVRESAARHPRLVDLSRAFDAHPELLWLDEVHVTPVGNQLLAASIVATMTPEWRARAKTED
jgi:lysophospholipase L1-like esterase